MADMDKLWQEVDNLKESRIRHDERMKQLEQGQARAMEHFAKLETKFDEIRTDIAAGFKTVSERIDSIEERKAENTGYRKGQMDALKKWGSLFAIITFAAGVIMWRIAN